MVVAAVIAFCIVLVIAGAFAYRFFEKQLMRWALVPGTEFRDVPMPQGPREMHETRTDPALGGGEEPASAEGRAAPQRARAFDQNDPATWSKTPRNAPCPCGSGKKYKQCHGQLA